MKSGWSLIAATAASLTCGSRNWSVVPSRDSPLALPRMSPRSGPRMGITWLSPPTMAAPLTCIEELLLRSEVNKLPTDWCCGGRFVIFVQLQPGTNVDLFALPVSGDKKPIPLLHSEFNEIEGTVSPDGRWLAYASDESGSYEVYV